MSSKPNGQRGFRIYLAVLTLLLILACVLFAAASAAHARMQPRIRESTHPALALRANHG